MRWLLRLLPLAVNAITACVDPIELPSVEVQVLDGGQGADVHSVWGCPDTSAWSIVTWPEVDEVQSTAVNVVEAGSGACRMELRPVAPLGARWYAIRSRAGEPAQRFGGIPLSDGSTVDRFEGVPEAFVRGFTIGSRSDGPYIRTVFSVPIQPAPGLEWRDLMTARQRDTVCVPPNPDGTLGLVMVNCEGVDWTQPVTVHVEGAVALYGGAVVPAIDLPLTFGAWTDTAEITIALLPVPPRVPAALCAGLDCE